MITAGCRRTWRASGARAPPHPRTAEARLRRPAQRLQLRPRAPSRRGPGAHLSGAEAQRNSGALFPGAGATRRIAHHRRNRRGNRRVVEGLTMMTRSVNRLPREAVDVRLAPAQSCSAPGGSSPCSASAGSSSAASSSGSSAPLTCAFGVPGAAVGFGFSTKSCGCLSSRVNK